MALSEMSILHARITRIDYTLGDSGSLTLNVTISGGKICFFRYDWTGKQKRMSLGCYPQISLKEARTRRDDASAPPACRSSSRLVVLVASICLICSSVCSRRLSRSRVSMLFVKAACAASAEAMIGS